MERFKKWSKAELMYTYKELTTEQKKRELTEEEKELLEQVTQELIERKVLNNE